MADRLGIPRVLDELLWTLRRGGFDIATSQAIDVTRAVEILGLADPFAVREAIASIVLERAADRPRFDGMFDEFFDRSGAPRRTLWARLEARGFTTAELDALRELLERGAGASADGQHLGALLERGPELDRLLYLAGIERAVDAARDPLQTGFFSYRVLDRLGVHRARDRIAAIASELRDALGEERGSALAEALRSELDGSSSAIRQYVQRAAERRKHESARQERARTLETAPFVSLSDAEVDEVRKAVRSFADRLRGAARVRSRHARRGRIDPHRTLRGALRTGGAPFHVSRKTRRRQRPRLVLLCDVSDSVRQVARFMLEFVYAVHELFDRTKSFVFVSELGETTDLFSRASVSVALHQAYGGGVVSVADNSNYGRVLRVFEERHLGMIDRRTTVVILGDGRTNYHDDAADVLDRLRARAKALLWLCPEERSGWSLGDSAMPRYAPRCTAVLQVRCARELEEAARALVALR
jgi:hypothetical protein